MKRFALFAGSNYYPDGGFNDFRGSFDTSAEAVRAVADLKGLVDWWHVIDLTTGQRVEWGFAS